MSSHSAALLRQLSNASNWRLTICGWVSASRWSRIHARQAVVLGIVGTGGYGVLLALPLLIVIAQPAISTTGVVVVYAAGILADLFGALFLFGLTLYYSGRASRGELFAIPLVTALVDRVFPGIR